MSPGSTPIASASSGDSPRSASGSDPGSFQTTASALGPGVCEILWVPFKSGVAISHSSLTLWKVSPAGFQSQTFWGLIFLVQDPWAGDLSVGLRPLAPWEEALQFWFATPVYELPIWGHGSWLCLCTFYHCVVVFPLYLWLHKIEFS